MIYIADSHFPITRFQLFFKGGLVLDPPSCPGLTLITQRQFLRGTQFQNRQTWLNQLETLGTDLNLISLSYALGVGGLTLTRHVDEVFRFLQEAFTHPLLSQEQIEQEKRSYKAELESAFDEDGLMAWIWMGRRLYHKHPLWNRVCLTPSAIQNISVSAVQEHWQTLFTQKKWMACISGSISEEQISRSLDQLKATLPQGEEYTLNLPPLPVLNRRRLTLIDQPNRQQVHLLIAHPTLSVQHPHQSALKLAITALGGTFSSPLMQEVRVKRGLSYGAQASLHSESGLGLITLNATPEVKDLSQTLEVIFTVLQKGIEGKLSRQEIEFARNYLVNSHPFQIETSAMRASLIARCHLQGIDPESQLNLDQKYKSLSFEEVIHASKCYLSLEHLEVVALGDLKQMQTQLSQLDPLFDTIQAYHVQDDPQVILDETK